MNERIFRIILGFLLITLLIIGDIQYLIAYIVLLLFEGITNWRIPTIFTKIFSSVKNEEYIVQGFEAERMLRFVVALFLALSVFIAPNYLSLFPWFIATMLLMAGITNICPMIISLRYLGFK